jgi:two-component system, NtrC family, response regulator AtoC
MGVEPDRLFLDELTLRRRIPMLGPIASSTISVLLLGETGVGKEIVAHAVHQHSPRAAAPMVCLNCCALSETLLESELFGYERGAFTGANRSKPGLLEVARGGTVFLDEVGEMPLGLQAKLLRVLEQREMLRVGALRPTPIDVRLISATNRNLPMECAAGRFRTDLYFRLDGISVTIAPLRDRKDEIPALARSFVARTSEQLGRGRPPEISSEAMSVLVRCAWPGNIRELRNVMERATVLSAGAVIDVEHLPDRLLAPSAPAPPLPPLPRPPTPPDAFTLAPRSMHGEELEGVLLSPAQERARIVAALRECRGNQTQAARLLGVSRRTLVSRLTEYGLPRPRRPRSA